MPGTQHFSLRISPSHKVEVVISVSKKVSKKAVARNLIKRRIRPILAKFKEKLKPGAYLLVVKPGGNDLRGELLQAELAQIFQIR